MINQKTAAIDDRGIVCYFKLHQRRELKARKATVMHVHGSWQLELILSGTQKIEFNNHAYELSKGALALIPPHTPHAFIYNSPTSWLSIKYDVAGNIPHHVEIIGRNRNTAVLQAILDALDAALPGYNPGAKTVATVNHLLAALTAHLYFTLSPNPQISSQLDRISSIVNQRSGRPLTVAEVAASLGYSTSHLSAWYRQHTGTSLKQFIDAERMNFARELLLYSDMNIGEIAEKLEFPDLFAFSSFFRRHQRQSPLSYRQDHTMKKVKSGIVT